MGFMIGSRDYGGGITIDPEDPRVFYISTNATNPFDLSRTTNVRLNTDSRYEIYRGFTADGGERPVYSIPLNPGCLCV